MHFVNKAKCVSFQATINQTLHLMPEITIDNEVFKFLKSEAVPFEDTPNTVLRRLLLKDRSGMSEIQNENQDPVVFKNKTRESRSSLERFGLIPDYLPNALQQTLQMVYLVKKENYSRIDATKELANYLNVKVPTITDKFTRQLSFSTYQVDAILSKNDLDQFQSILKEKYTSFEQEITEFFNKLNQED